MKTQYNLVVIGAGSGGLVSAYIAAAVNAKVALIEKHLMGGDCLNTGCVPSKALIRTASVVQMIRRHKEFGLKDASVDFDFAEIMERVQRVIRKVEPHDSVERYTKLGVECIQGEARILDPYTVEVNGRTLTTKNIIVATGAGPYIPDIAGIEKIRILHTNNIWDIREQPERLLVIGGGPIGAELSQCFARLGTKVTIVQRSQMLPKEDPDVAELLISRMKEEGVECRPFTTPKEFSELDKRKFLRVVDRDGKVDTIEFDEVLFAVGRQANTRGFGLEELGVELNENGTIKVDAYARTSVPSIFACGDVASPYQFTHMAAHQAWYCAVNSLFKPIRYKVNLNIVPWCTYTDPEIARVGLSEHDAKAKGIPYEITSYGVDDLDRAIADEEDYGVVKVLTVPGKDRILGVTICANHAGDLLPEYISAMKHGHGLNDILGTIHMYPTMAEANKYAAGVWKKNHAPQGVLNFLKKFHAWRRG